MAGHDPRLRPDREPIMNEVFTGPSRLCATLDSCRTRVRRTFQQKTENTMKSDLAVLATRTPPVTDLLFILAGLVIAVFALLQLAASTAAAQTIHDRAATPDEAKRISETLTQSGYTDIHDIEVDDGRFEVDARNRDGQSIDLELDLKTLEILHEDRD